MPDETIELTEVQEVIEDLSSPTSEQMMQAVRGYSERAIGSAAALIALEGGGGGGESLPNWWTVDSTEDEESVIFNGAVTIDPVGSGAFPLLIQGADGQSAAMLAIDDFDGNTLYEVSSAGLVESVSGFRVEMDGEPGVGELGGGTLTLANSDDQTVLDLSDAPSLSLSVGGNAVFEVDDTGAVTISPSDDVVAETVNAAAGQTENIAEWQLDGTPLAWLEADGTPGGTLGAWGGFPLAAASPFIYISSVSAMSGAQAGRGVRIVCPRSGTLRDLCVYVGTSAGNVDIGVYTTDEPRARFYSSGSVATPAADGWRIVGDPQLAVVAGDQYDFVLSCDDASATFGRDALPPAAAVQRLPDGMLAGGIPYLAWQAAGDIFPLPATIAEADIAPEIRLVLIGRIE